ncbi:hypothetical protein CAP48_09655 [Advenella sp. S44]|nr:hypothetical protein CAP48_09655 [Advenella sp. S44]
MQYDLNRHWQVRLRVGQPGYITVCRGILVALAMLCIAGPQAAVLFFLLALAARRHVTHGQVDKDTVLEVTPDGHYRLYPLGTQEYPSHGTARVLLRYWQGPFWFTLVLRDPYFPLSPPNIVTVWSSGQAPDAWRRFCVLVQSAQWANTQGGAARHAI